MRKPLSAEQQKRRRDNLRKKVAAWVRAGSPLTKIALEGPLEKIRYKGPWTKRP